jgi:hypothetical protein
LRGEKNRLNGFSWARSWFTALKRGVNEMISTEQVCHANGTPISRLARIQNPKYFTQEIGAPNDTNTENWIDAALL